MSGRPQHRDGLGRQSSPQLAAIGPVPTYMRDRRCNRAVRGWSRRTCHGSCTDQEASEITTVQMGTRKLTLGGPYLGELQDANPYLDDADMLRHRMAEDGYLLVRGFHVREKVEAARRSILENLAANGQVD